MFEGVEAGGDDGGGKRAAVSTGVSLVVYGIIAAVLVAVGGSIGAKVVEKDEPVEVSFKTPAPPPPVEEAAKPPPPAPKPKARQKSNEPPAAPTIISDEQLAEGNEKDFRSSVSRDALESLGAPVEGDGPGGLGGGAPPPPPPPPVVTQGGDNEPDRPVYMRDPSTRPVARSGNASPVYPEVARKKGREGVVVLRFVVTTDGRVSKIQVVSGDEPFVSAAIAVVQRWRYQPATVDGRAEPVYHRVRIPFRLKAS